VVPERPTGRRSRASRGGYVRADYHRGATAAGGGRSLGAGDAPAGGADRPHGSRRRRPAHVAGSTGTGAADGRGGPATARTVAARDGRPSPADRAGTRSDRP